MLAYAILIYVLACVSAVPLHNDAAFRPYGKIEQPANTKVKSIVRGYGTQNFTCNGGKFEPLGAVARLYDLSSVQTQLPENKATKTPKLSKFDTPLIGNPVGYHSSVIGADGKAEPVWAFGPNLDIHGRLLEAADSPVAPGDNVRWLLLAATGKGQYADFVIRSETLGGYAPSR